MSVKQYERENNARRTKDRKRARMLNGYRNTGNVPGYNYIKDEVHGGRIIVPKEPHATIIKEGLEKFAKGILVNQVQLMDFLNERGLKSLYKGKIRLSFIERLLSKDRLLFFAGYINYPRWDIEMVKGKHPHIITLNTVGKIMKRLDPKQFYKSYTANDIAERLPMRGILKCSCCGKPVSGCPSKGKGGTYYYYSCRQKGCDLYGKSFNADKLHGDIEELLESMSIDTGLLKAFGAVLTDVWQEANQTQHDKEKRLKREIQTINQKIERLQDRIIETDSIDMIELYEKKITDLIVDKESLENELLATDEINKQGLLRTLQEAELVLTNPLFVRQLPNLELKRLMLNIIFNGNITYTKKGGLRTPEMPLIYKHLSLSTHSNNHSSRGAGFEPATSASETDMLPLTPSSFLCCLFLVNIALLIKKQKHHKKKEMVAKAVTLIEP